MKLVIPFAALAVLAACATPQQQCINQASRDYRAVQAKAETAQGNIDRGYAILRQNEPYMAVGVCYDAARQPYPCPETRYRTQETPVSISIPEERRKLAGYRHLLPRLRREADRGAAQCRREYPE